MSAEDSAHCAVDDEFEVDCVSIAGGGAVIAHHLGRTLLVRHALPGERVVVRVTEVRSKIVRADAVRVIRGGDDRVAPPCPAAHAGGCGGCDLQHVRPEAQRRWKAQVVHDALRRAGVWNNHVEVEALPGPGDGLRWRTRMRWAVAPDGRLGLRRHRSHEVEVVDDCLIASRGIAEWKDAAGAFPGATHVTTTQGGSGAVSVTVDDAHVAGPSRAVEDVGARRWRRSPRTFWQVHPCAPAALTECVMQMAEAAPGEVWWDLYAGAGLFSAPLAETVGATGRIEAVEASPSAVRDARRALHDLAWVHLHECAVERWQPPAGQQPSGVVLDPPRAGALPAVLDAVVAAAPARIVYVSCDPMTLGRDLAMLTRNGYRVWTVRAFDTFPMTHHIETVAALRRIGAPHQIS